jgi:membrane protein implicated in regulation of membrane protease activity
MALALGILGLLFLPTPWNVVAVSVAALIEVGEVFIWIRFLRRYRIKTGAEALIGRRVRVVEACDPRGRVALGDEFWNAVTEDLAAPLEAGAEATITAIDGLTLSVRSREGHESDPGQVYNERSAVDRA